jgi:GNAT superfamily N-acetyltransferase
MDTFSPPANLTVRKAEPPDADALLHLIRGLADYEKLPPPGPEAHRRLINDLFSTPPRLQAFLGEYHGTAVGYALVFETYSSFLALPTLYLEDIFVVPEYRKKKVGVALFLAMVREAHARGCGRMEWAVLDWNRLAVDFYEKMGARRMNEWQLFRLVRSDMEDLLSPTHR